jgi:flagellar hook protein FlgE
LSGEVSTIQSLKAVDAWIDVINANINGGVRTAFKSSRLKFSGTNVDVARSGSSTSLPLQFPEAGLTTANTVIDFSQGAVTASTENSHLAIQGEGFFMVVNPASVYGNGSIWPATANTKLMITRDGEFRTNQLGQLVNANGWLLVSCSFDATGQLNTVDCRTVYNDLDITTPSATLTAAVRLSDFVANAGITNATLAANGASFTANATTMIGPAYALATVTRGAQSLQYSQFGSTVFDFGQKFLNVSVSTVSPNLGMAVATSADATVLTKSLEASNASMTQSVPELSLAQKLFSALTKVLQTKQTNVDGVLNLVR